MKVNISHIILIIIIGILGFMYLTKPVETIHDTSREDSLINVIDTKNISIKSDSIAIDSLSTLILKEKELRLIIEKDLNELTKEYEGKISSVDSGSVNDDINFFKSRYISEIKSN